MKIDRDKKGFGNYRTLGASDPQGVQRGKEGSFNQEMEQQKEQASRYKMQELLIEIDKTGEKLSKSININDLMLYKKLVKNFLKEASSQAFLLKQERGRSRRGRAILLSINVIDSEVENLIEEFIRDKKEPFELLENLDKIRGMLVDLLA